MIVFLHVHYEDVAREAVQYLLKSRREIGLVVTATNALSDHMTRRLSKLSARITQVENRGRDVRPFLTALHSTPCDLVCKVHTKNGPFRYAGAWRHIMFETLLHPKAIKNVRAAFERHPRLMLVGPSVLYKSARGLMFGNEYRIARLSHELFGREPPADWGFFPGTMFWARRSALEPMLGREFPFEPEPIGENGFMPHAFERLFGLLPVYLNAEVGLVDYDTKEIRIQPASGPFYAETLSKTCKRVGAQMNSSSYRCQEFLRRILSTFK